MRIFLKAFHFLLFDGSFIFPKCILIFGLILLLMIDSTSDKKDIAWLYFISSTSLVMSIMTLLVRWREEPMISFSGNFQTNNFNEIFQFLILLCSTLCIPLSVEYNECTKMAIIEFLLFVLTTSLRGMFLCCANNLITIFVALECFSLCSYLLFGYTKRDVRSNEATTKYLLIGGASSSILIHGFSWLYGSFGGEIKLQEIVNGLINTQMYNSPGISIALIFIIVGIGFKLSPSPSHQWTLDLYEGVNPLFDSDSPTLVIAFLSITSKAGNLIAITQISMKRMLAYLSIGQIEYVIIEIIVGDSNGGYASMITYMLFYIYMNLGTFACIVSFGLCTRTDNIRDYVGLYMKYPFLAFSLALCLLSLGGLPPIAGFFFKNSIYFEITPHVRNYIRSLLRSNNSIELSMIVCVKTSTIPRISMNPIIAIAQDTFFLVSMIYFLVQDPSY
ncbi:hypothetical protein AAG906_005734 [Vitis piasezkii]